MSVVLFVVTGAAATMGTVGTAATAAIDLSLNYINFISTRNVQ